MEDILHVLASWISAGANTGALVRDRYPFRHLRLILVRSVPVMATVQQRSNVALNCQYLGAQLEGRHQLILSDSLYVSSPESTTRRK